MISFQQVDVRKLSENINEARIGAQQGRRLQVPVDPGFQPVRCFCQIIQGQSQELQVLSNVVPIFITQISLLSNDCRVTIEKTLNLFSSHYTLHSSIFWSSCLRECPKVIAPSPGDEGSTENNAYMCCWPSTASSFWEKFSPTRNIYIIKKTSYML